MYHCCFSGFSQFYNSEKEAMYHCCFLYFTTAVFVYFRRVITVRRKPCTTAVFLDSTTAGFCIFSVL